MDTASEKDKARDVSVRRLIYRDADSGFTVIQADPDEGGSTFVAAGVFPIEVSVGDPLRLFGAFETHQRFGERFKVDAVRPRTPATSEGIQRYLASGRVPGIGPKLAERLVTAFGDRTLEILENDPGRILEVPGVGQKKLQELRRALEEGKEQREVLVYLQGLGIGPALSMSIWTQLGNDAVARIQSDPYGLCRIVNGIGFPTADRIAASLGIEGDDPLRLKAGLQHALRVAAEKGHLCLGVTELIERACGLLAQPQAGLREALQAALDQGELACVAPQPPPLVAAEEPRVYLPVLLKAEEEAARRLLELAEAPRPRPRDGGGIPLDASGRQLTPEQKDAVRLLLDAKVAVLSGGPGVGKTTVLKTVVRSYEASGFRLELASPTGRAARRLEEATNHPAKTLHRLFGLIPGLETRKASEPLDTDVLVIDEASMVDLPLLLRVLRRLHAETILIFVGDPDQLPSVGPGQILADLLTSRRFETARLTKIFRQKDGGLLVENAHRVLAGALPEQPPRGALSDFYFTPSLDPARGAELILRLYLERMPARFGLDPRTDIQILAPMHRGTCGVEALNQRIAERLNGDGTALEARGRVFHEGDRVMQLRNDYDRDVMNGDLGRVLRVEVAERRLLVDFEGREIVCEGNDLSDLDLAFAITVHKSQGGEFPAVIVPLFSEHLLMLKRKLLYTAMTRARRLLVLVGTEKALSLAIQAVEEGGRFGSFRERLMGLPVAAVAPW